jgi:hypothetical protein
MKLTTTDEVSTTNQLIECGSTNFCKFKNMETHLKMFHATTNLDDFRLLVNQLKVLSQPKNTEQRAMLAYVILFNCDQSLLLTDNQV